MIKFLKNNILEMCITILLAILIGIGGYFIRKSEAQDTRIWTLEMSKSSTDEQIRALDAKLDNLSLRIGEMKVDLVAEINSQCLYLRELIRKERGINDGNKH